MQCTGGTVSSCIGGWRHAVGELRDVDWLEHPIGSLRDTAQLAGLNSPGTTRRARAPGEPSAQTPFTRLLIAVRNRRRTERTFESEWRFVKVLRRDW